jgi:glycosyltransferase involved in cell wall biosynthesis
MLPITAITTVYRTQDLLVKTYESFREFYPGMSFIIIDNSADGSCTHLTKVWLEEDAHLTVFENDENQGHGDGMHQGIALANSVYLFIFDSDVTFVKPNLLEDMMEYMNSEVYGVGWLLDLDRGGRNVPKDYDCEIIRYLYPAFMLLNKVQYYNFHKFTRFGLPPLRAMQEIHDQGLDKLLIDFPVSKYITHKSGATRGRYGDCEDIVSGFTGRKGDMNSLDI